MERSDDYPLVLHYGEEEIQYAVRVNPKRRERVRISVLPDGTVEVEAPEKTTPDAIGKAVRKRARWIVSHVADARRRFENVLPREYVSGEQVLYLGRRYVLKVVPVPRPERSVKLRGGRLMVATETTDGEAIKGRLRAWYRVKARDYFDNRIRDVCRRLPWVQSSPPFRLLVMNRQWGSCATSGTLTLNPLLVKAPRECIDYVITHELCHLREHNHSPEFFRLLFHAMPEWERTKLRLDQMAEVIFNE